jgi:putative hydrolase of the HAD superfamily
MFEVILFDLGRVVVGLGESPIPKCWLKDKNALTFEAWINSDIGQRFEKGELTSIEFVTLLKQELQLDQSIKEITEAFAAWPIGMFPKMSSILKQLRENHHLAVLSNTNELHFPRLIEEFNIAEHFDTIFVSHHMKMAKPDPKAFEHVLDVLEVSPDKVLFLDDNASNIKAAEGLGISSDLVCGEEEVIAALRAHNLLPC